LSLLNRLLIVAILASTLLAILETEPELAGWERLFAASELGFLILFALEFLARLWTASERGEGSSFSCRLRSC
jgi:hypothetical protein